MKSNNKKRPPLASVHSNSVDGSLSSLEMRLAQRMAGIRQEKGFSQADLARKSGLSPAYLSRVESMQAALTLANLEKVALALAVSPLTLLEESETIAPLALYRSGSGIKKLLRGADSHSYVMLAEARKAKLMEPIIVEVKSSAKAAVKSSHVGDEFNYVIEGNCTFFYGKNEIQLKTGDAVYYDASIPHGVVARRGIKTRLLVLVSSRDYLFHGDISGLLGGNGKYK